MNVLLVGSGGREHALAWKLSRSPDLSRLVCAPGNPGVAAVCEIRPVAVADVEGLAALAVEIAADLVVVGPEAPLEAGLADRLGALGIACFGPTRTAARLETSKVYLKALAARLGLPTARHVEAGDRSALEAALDGFDPPFVIKVDGLAAGKGVVIAQDRAEALREGVAMLEGRFGAAGRRLVVEEFMPGEEASLFALTDGVHVVPFGGAQDHKRIFDGDLGPNTGGMGAYAPAPVLTPALEALACETIIKPALAGLAAEGAPYRGVLYAGLMIREGRPRLVEFNVRFGDPECQALMLGLQSDLLPYLRSAAAGGLERLTPPVWKPGSSVCVVLAADGYPEAPQTGAEILGVAEAETGLGEDAAVFHAGTRRDAEGRLRAAGGRVLNVCARGDTLKDARARAYDLLSRISLEGGRYRRDIGWRALAPS